MNIGKESVYKKCLGRNPFIRNVWEPAIWEMFGNPLYGKGSKKPQKICHAAQPVPQPTLTRELSNYCTPL